MSGQPEGDAWAWWKAWCKVHHPDAVTEDQMLAKLLMTYAAMVAK